MKGFRRHPGIHKKGDKLASFSGHCLACPSDNELETAENED